MQFVASQVPDVVECRSTTHCHSTVSPAVIVVRLLPLMESTKLFPPDPTRTTWLGLGVGDGVTVGVAVEVSVGVRVAV